MNRSILAALLPALLLSSPARAAPTIDRATLLSRFRTHMADPSCSGSGTRWRSQYAPFVRRLDRGGDRVQSLFVDVMDRMISAGLPTEYALIPFVESHYLPGARSGQGPAGMWQFTEGTARVHGLKVAKGRDDRLSPDASTRAAVAYLKMLHRQFHGDWRTVLMAYNAGDGRMRAARRRGRVGGLSPITRNYPDKIEAIACEITRERAPRRGHGHYASEG